MDHQEAMAAVTLLQGIGLLVLITHPHRSRGILHIRREPLVQGKTGTQNIPGTWALLPRTGPHRRTLRVLLCLRLLPRHPVDRMCMAGPVGVNSHLLLQADTSPVRDQDIRAPLQLRLQQPRPFLEVDLLPRRDLRVLRQVRLHHTTLPNLPILRINMR